MRIKKMEVCNFRSVSRIRFDFLDTLNLFVGINGSGKSTILDALSICLSWLVKRIEKETGRGSYIPDSSLRINETTGFLALDVNEEDMTYGWVLAKAAPGSSSDMGSELSGANELARIVRRNHSRNSGWPVIAYYPINRVVGSIRPEISAGDLTYSLDVYENALGGKANYQSFFEWFRLQDDILNEEALSRSRWMIYHRNWIKRRVRRLSYLLEEAMANNEQPIDSAEFRYLADHFSNDDMVYAEPRFLLKEMSRLINKIRITTHRHVDYERVIDSLMFMFDKMASLSDAFRDDLIEEGGLHSRLTEDIARDFDYLWHLERSDDKVLLFLWESFSFAMLLSLWWLSDRGRQDLERELQILKRPEPLHSRLKSKMRRLPFSLKEIVGREIHLKRTAFRKEGQELRTVTEAIERFVPEYNNLRVKRFPRPHMLIDKDGAPFNLDQLSDGEKGLIALVGDIARRLAIANPRHIDPLKGDGVILIDEIDLHLHPRWQRLVVPKLLEVFPNCQFFISTHSPQVISHVKPESVFLLGQGDDGLYYTKAEETYGMSLDRIVELVMEDEPRPVAVSNDLDKLFELIERKRLKEASKLLSSLRKDLKTDPELTRAETLIHNAERKK